jgi:cation transport ATPase
MVNHSTLSGPSRLETLKEWASARFDGIGHAIARQTRPALAESNRALAVSTASVGLTVAGALTLQPLLVLAGVPLVLYVYAPAFQSAWRSIRKQRRIDGSVLDATRIAVCVVMGYYGTGVANAALYALSQRVQAQSEDDFEESLRGLLGLQAEDTWAFVDGVEILTQLDEITGGQILVANAGDLLPAGGTVLYGSAQVDQRLATGDVAPVQKEIGDTVLLASRVVSGQLAVTVGDSPERLDLTDLRETLRRSVQSKTFVQQLGEGSGRRAAPLSFATFLLTIPWLGINRAASFLCTSFGANMRVLGPVAARSTIQQAAQEGILIKESKALELANFVNCLVIDGQTLLDPGVRLHAAEIVQELRQRNWQATGLFGRPFAVYVLADGEHEGLRSAAAAIGAEDVFVEPLSIGRAAVIDNLQRSGRAACYVSKGQDDGPVMEKALVSVALGGALSAPTNPAQIIFVEKSLAPLLPFFEISTQFLEKERFSLLTPVMMDLTDITTTIVIHFGLIYSTFFNYGSLLLSLHNAGTPKTRPQVQAVEPVKTVAIVPVSPGQIRERNDRKEAKKTDSVLWRWGRKSGASWLGA